MIELLIALVLAGIFAVVLFTFVNGQARFTLVQDARQEVEQNSRGAIELMMSEIRAVPGGAITIADPDRVQFRLPRIWGLLCAPVAGNTAKLVFPPAQAEGAVFPSDYAAGGSWGLGVLDASVTTSNQFGFAGVSDTTAYDAAGDATCRTGLGVDLTAAADSNPPKALTLNLAAMPTVVGDTGDLAFLYQMVTYDVGSSSVAAGDWLRRSTAANGTAQQPVAGPLSEEDDSPLTFTYYCRGAVINGADATKRPFITSIRITAAMQSRPSTRSVLQTERDTVTVHLRNSGAILSCP